MVTTTWYTYSSKTVGDIPLRGILKSRLEAEILKQRVDDFSVVRVSMPILLSGGAELTSGVSEDPDDNTIFTKATGWEDEPYDIFEDPFEVFLNSNVFTVEGCNMNKYVI